MLQILLRHLSGQNQSILPFLLLAEKLLARARRTWQFIFFQWKRAPALLRDALQRVSPPGSYLELRISRQKLIWNKFSPCRGTTPKAAKPAVVTCRLQIFWKTWSKQQESHSNQQVLHGLRFCYESSIWFWLQRKKIFPLRLPWLGFLLLKAPTKRRTGMPQRSLGTIKSLEEYIKSDK